MADIIIHDAGSEEHSHAEHCPECERRFAEIEKRLLEIEQHHPIMDQNTEIALETAEEAVAMAEEAQEAAEEAKVEAEVAAATAVVASLEPENAGEEEIADATPIIDETGSSEEAGISGEEESEEPVVIQPAEPEPEPERRRTGTRFARGRRG